MPIRNYFEETLRFNPHELRALEPHLEVLSVRGLKEKGKGGRGLREEGGAGQAQLKSIRYRYYGIEFRTDYFTHSDTYRSVIPEQPLVGRTFLENFSEIGTLREAVESARRVFEKEAFRSYLSWLMNNAFSAPYAHREVRVIEKDQEKKIAKLEVDRFIKMVAAYRLNRKNKYLLRVAGRNGLQELECPSLTKLGREMRPIVSSRYRAAPKKEKESRLGKLLKDS